MTDSPGPDREYMEQLYRQARECLGAGDVRGARQIWEAALQIDPDDALALQGLASTQEGGGVVASDGEQAGEGSADELDLALDLALDTGVVPAPTPSAPAAASRASGSGDPAAKPQSLTRAAVTTLEVEAEGDDADVDLARTGPVPEPVGQVETSPGAGAGLATPAEEGGEAALLVSRARQALAAGRLEEATGLASRALAIADGMPSAVRVLEGARAESQRRETVAERSLTDAIEALDAGRAAEAIPLLEKVQELVPGHAEARDYLARAKSQLKKQDKYVDTETDFDAIESIPLDVPASEAADEDAAETGQQPEPQADEPPSPPPPPPPPLSAGHVGARGVPLPPPSMLGGRRTPLAAPAEPSESGSAGSRASKFPLGAVAIVVVALLAIAAAIRFGPGLIGPRAGDPASGADAQQADAGEVSSGASAPAAEVAPPETSAAPVEPPSSEAPAPAQPAPAYSPEDVPELMSRAAALLERGEEQRAVELLRAAQLADPSNFRVIDALDTAQKALGERRLAQQRLDEGARAFDEGMYEEALRVFYRVPKTHRPPELDRWIADGWYNLGVQALQTGSVAEAVRFFSDSLDLAPGDPEAIRHREVALRYRRRGLDDAYRIYVGSLQPRPLAR